VISGSGHRLPGVFFLALWLFIPEQGGQNATRSAFARKGFMGRGRAVNKGLSWGFQFFFGHGIGVAKGSSRANSIT
jgi:hypothetical protein